MEEKILNVQQRVEKSKNLSNSDLRPVNFCDIEIRGELAVRSGFNFSRLEGQWYRPKEVFTADQHGWPGDWEGRVILGLTMLAQSTHRTPAYLETILSMMPEYLNEKGYIGRMPAKGVVNEQQLAGHSWLLRGLIEYYYWKKDENILARIKTLVENLLLPAKPNYQNYPLEFEERNECKDWELSHPQTKNKDHSETVDTGCAFIMLDGATVAYELLKLPQLKELIETMIERFTKIDLVDIRVQTHATLTATRGIIRFYELTKHVKYLRKAEELFALYKNEAWTENYANYNWFSRPRWTEPCAVIDSFIVAVWLWKLTGNCSYLEDAHHIYFNAISHGQRNNGGFGTDHCLGADEVFLYPNCFESYWCCTMRGGEGLSRAIEFNFYTNNNELILPFYNDCTAVLHFPDGAVKIHEKTGYPCDGNVSLEIIESTLESKKEVRFFAPSWTSQEKIEIYLNGKKTNSSFKDRFITIKCALKKGDKINFDLSVGFHVEERINKNNTPGYHTFRHGALILAAPDGKQEQKIAKDTVFECIDNCNYRIKDTDVILSPINDVTSLTTPESKRQVLFSNE